MVTLLVTVVIFVTIKKDTIGTKNNIHDNVQNNGKIYGLHTLQYTFLHVASLCYFIVCFHSKNNGNNCTTRANKFIYSEILYECFSFPFDIVFCSFFHLEE